MSWTECSNPLNNKVQHYFDRDFSVFCHYQNMCSMCWSKLLVLEKYQNPISTSHEPVKAFKQAGNDTL